ncbi:hypothetical protein XENOCAPTIV_015323 [Xenoophorus captivus]|uniref:Uncharacterized protein n=1 Tax=Xenoophorus captivus TaxID=1517983 RepID=A0ABV0QA50_9TELE
MSERTFFSCNREECNSAVDSSTPGVCWMKKSCLTATTRCSHKQNQKAHTLSFISNILLTFSFQWTFCPPYNTE